MKNIIKYIGLFIVAAPFLGACDDSKFLEEKPKTFYTRDNAFSTSAQVDQAVIACYSHVRVMFTSVEENTAAFAFRGGNGTDMFDVATRLRPGSSGLSPTGTLGNSTEGFQ